MMRNSIEVVEIEIEMQIESGKETVKENEWEQEQVLWKR